jgi:hypothetical protein
MANEESQARPGERTTAPNLKPLSGPCSDRMNTSVWSRESVGNVISCSKRMVENAQSLPTKPSCRVSDSCNAHY